MNQEQIQKLKAIYSISEDEEKIKKKLSKQNKVSSHPDSVLLEYMTKINTPVTLEDHFDEKEPTNGYSLMKYVYYSNSDSLRFNKWEISLQMACKNWIQHEKRRELPQLMTKINSRLLFTIISI